MADALGDVMAAQVAGLGVETKAAELSAAIAAVSELIETAKVIDETHGRFATTLAWERFAGALAHCTGAQA